MCTCSGIERLRSLDTRFLYQPRSFFLSRRLSYPADSGTGWARFYWKSQFCIHSVSLGMCRTVPASGIFLSLWFTSASRRPHLEIWIAAEIVSGIDLANSAAYCRSYSSSASIVLKAFCISFYDLWLSLYSLEIAVQIASAWALSRQSSRISGLRPLFQICTISSGRYPTWFGLRHYWS